MPTKHPRIIITVPENMLEKIDDYRYACRIPTRSEAVRKLIKTALDDFKKGKSNIDK